MAALPMITTCCPVSSVYLPVTSLCITWIFFSALVNEGRKAEALKYLRLAVAYNPAYKELLEQCENEDEEFGSDLVNSRRRDY